jgi:hypothetical protein
MYQNWNILAALFSVTKLWHGNRTSFYYALGRPCRSIGLRCWGSHAVYSIGSQITLRLLALRTGCPLFPKLFLFLSGIHFCQILSKPQGLERLEGLGKLEKKINYLFGSQIRDLDVFATIYYASVFPLCLLNNQVNLQFLEDGNAQSELTGPFRLIVDALYSGFIRTSLQGSPFCSGSVRNQFSCRIWGPEWEGPILVTHSAFSICVFDNWISNADTCQNFSIIFSLVKLVLPQDFGRGFMQDTCVTVSQVVASYPHYRIDIFLPKILLIEKAMY